MAAKTKPAPRVAEPVRIPHVWWRDGRPRFAPGEPIRALGFKSQDLRHEDGRWYTAGEALDWSRRISEEIEAARAKARKRATARIPPSAAVRAPVSLYTVHKLMEDWFRSPRFPQPVPRGEAEGEPSKGLRLLAPATVRFYRQMARVLEQHDAELYDSAVAAIDRPIVYGLYEDLVRAVASTPPPASSARCRPR